jgi:hypothetical protein
MREGYGAFPDWGPLNEDSATKLKRGQLNVCTVYICVLCMVCTLFPPVAEVCARMAGNFYLKLTTVKSGAYDLVWLSVCYFTST